MKFKYQQVTLWNPRHRLDHWPAFSNQRLRIWSCFTVAALALLIPWALVDSVEAQEAIGATPTYSLPEAVSNLPTQPIGPNDLVAVSVYGSPELTRATRVAPDGCMRLPMLKNCIHATGQTPTQLEAAITTALIDDHILVHPVVTVTIAEYRSRPVDVVGAVKNPSVFQATQPITLLDAIARAGGLREDAASEILVSRPSSDGNNSVWNTQKVPVRGLIDGADPTLNLLLHGGEEVLVPEAWNIYVVGNVKHPGAFPIKEDQDMTVLQALAVSEGLAPYTNKTAYIIRKNPTGPKSEIPVPLTEIMQRKAPDVRLQANDILYIPENNRKKVTAETLDRLTSFGVQTVSGVLIWK